jgi:hypothetical protein
MNIGHNYWVSPSLLRRKCIRVSSLISRMHVTSLICRHTENNLLHDVSWIYFFFVKGNKKYACERICLEIYIIIQGSTPFEFCDRYAIVISYIFLPLRLHTQLDRYGLRAGRLVFDSRQEQEIFPYTTAARPALRPFQPHIQWVPGDLFSRIKRPGGEAENSPPPHVFMAWCLIS